MVQCSSGVGISEGQMGNFNLNCSLNRKPNIEVFARLTVQLQLTALLHLMEVH